ncbi:MAG: hypothetical protein IPM82_06860 [Saprospiraceae bacterium]|nr:hypothetical protein [Saprospiraceae bacterium]
MELPFTLEQFLEVFRQYNLGVFPIQFLFLLLAVAVLAFAIWPKKNAGRAISAILGLLWLWMGIVYHWGYFAGINKAAYFFGVAFVAQGGLFLAKGALRNQLNFSHRPTPAVWAGSAMMLYSLVIYPLLGHILGHSYPASPTFGLPCPTTIFTLGILLWLDKKPPFYLLFIPLAWSVIGTVAAFKLGIREDIGLAVAGGLTVLLMVRQRPL